MEHTILCEKCRIDRRHKTAKEYVSRNPDLARDRHRDYQRQNKDKVNEYQRNRWKVLWGSNCPPIPQIS